MTTQTLSLSEAASEVSAIPRRRNLSEARRKQVAEAWTVFSEAASGSMLAKARLQEMMTRSDFPELLGTALDRKLVAEYEAIAPVWQEYASREVVPNFLAQTWVSLLGGKGALDKVGELEQYPQRAYAEGTGSFRVEKYGAGMGISWESVVNDRLAAFKRMPADLAIAAREQEERVATLQLTDGNGPNAGLFSATAVVGLAGATSSNLLASNPVLDEDNLQAALSAIGVRVDFDGRPVIVAGSVLVVPPALEVTANRLVNATEVRTQIGTGSNSKLVITTNPLAGKVRVVVNPWLILDAGANVATTWYVLPDPKSNRRPAVVVAFLEGHEAPDLRVKNDQGSRPDGGSIAPEEGSFEDDGIRYRVRHVLGGGAVDANATAYSNGSGS